MIVRRLFGSLVLVSCSTQAPIVPNDGGTSGVDCGSTATTLIASAQSGPSSVVVDTTNVYWANTYELMKAPIGGGAPVTLASVQNEVAGNIGSIAVDATSVYWTVQALDTGTVMKVALDGSNAVVLASGQNAPFGIAVDKASVYWANWGLGNASTPTQNTIMRSPLDGGTPIALASNSGNPYAIAVDDAAAYYTLPGGYVMSVSLDGGAAQPLTPLGGEPTSLAIDAANIYWLDIKAGAVDKMLKTGGAITTLATYPPAPNTLGQTALRIAVDATNVYWIIPGDASTSSSCGGNGKVMSVPIAGGATTTIASEQSYPQGIAVDATSIYWTNETSGTVVKLSPK